jgi:hypothetical protein
VEPPPVDVSTLRELYTTPPAQFVSARNQLVKDRRAAKDREAAAALGKLRKPTLADWALNVVTARHGDDVMAFLDAAGTVRDAQAAAIEGRKGPDIRAALRDLREHSGQVLSRAQEVLAEAGRDAAAETGVVASRLTDLSANEEASAQLAAGVLGSEGLITPELFGELEPAPGRRAATGRSDKRSAAPKKQPAASATKARKEHQQALSRATRARDVAARNLTRADTAVEKAAAAVRNAERQLEQAREALSAAETDRDETARRLADAEDEVSAAERALDRAAR